MTAAVRRKQVIAAALLAVLTVSLFAAVAEAEESDAYTTEDQVSYTYELGTGGDTYKKTETISWSDGSTTYSSTLTLRVMLIGGKSAVAGGFVTNNDNSTRWDVQGADSYGVGTFTKTVTYSNSAYSTTRSITYTVIENVHHLYVYTYSASLQFEANGGAGAPDKVTAWSSSTSLSSLGVTVPSGQPTWSGHAFLGWAKSAGAATASYQAGDTVIVPYDGTVKLYAIWQITTVTVTFQPGNGSAATTAAVNAGSAISDWPADPVKSGYLFTGWYTDSACTALYDTTAAVTSDMTLYGGWQTELAFTSAPAAANIKAAASAVYDNAVVLSAAGSVGAVTWDFGDGQTAAGGLYVTHCYAAPGDYQVTLTVTGTDGSDTVTQTVTAAPVPTAGSDDGGPLTLFGVAWYWLAAGILLLLGTGAVLRRVI